MNESSASVAQMLKAATRHEPQHLVFPPQTRRFGRDLFNLQLWCWGCDIRSPGGNLLLRYGFERHPGLEPGRATNYSLRPTPSTYLRLWGFGMFWGDCQLGGIFLRRFDFAPVLSPEAELPEDVFDPSGIPSLRSPYGGAECDRTIGLLTAALRWCSGYERWITVVTEPAHRRASIATWGEQKKPTPVRSEEMSDAWRCLARDCTLLRRRPVPGENG